MSESRAKQRADRIRNEVPLDQVLENFGYAVVSGSDREQQFSCDLHGDGSDGKPSARYYPESTSWYCFACGRARDAIATTMEKQGASFSDACRLLESQFNLPPLPWKDESPKEPSYQEVVSNQKTQPTIDEMAHTLNRLLDGFTKDGTFTLETSLRLWEAYDRILFMHREKQVSEDKVRSSLERIAGNALNVNELCRS